MIVPSIYKKDNAGSWSYRPDEMKIFEEAVTHANANKIPHSSKDKKKVHLLLIDVQKDFCHKEGNLYVGGRSGEGAIEDSQRITEFIYRKVDRITEITTTLDTHFAFQIFFPWFWLDINDRYLEAHSVIDTDMIKTRKVRPNPAISWWLANNNYMWLEQYVAHYTTELEKAGKYQLYIWPPHCIIGSEGHNVVGIIHEARMFHCFARGSQSLAEIKGGHPLTENYSVLSPEVRTRQDGQVLTQKNVRFIKTLLDSDIVIIAGQAASHCVKSTIDDLLGEIKAQDPSLAKKIYIMKDCMSSVVVPSGPDFTDDANNALDQFASEGMHVVESTDDKWLDEALS
ncbi:MAG: nicotinamidase [Candidatus Hodarchaeales archaeon]